MVIKLDMENAFDHVRHSFLFKVLEKLVSNLSFSMGSILHQLTLDNPPYE
jgi:hypothetical protein